MLEDGNDGGSMPYSDKQRLRVTLKLQVVVHDLFPSNDWTKKSFHVPSLNIELLIFFNKQANHVQMLEKQITSAIEYKEKLY